MPKSPKHYAFDTIKKMKAHDLLDDLGITSTGIHKSFVVNGGDKWTVWMTTGRGKQHGKFYVHIETKMLVPVVDEKGKFTGADVEDVMHFRGRPQQTIGNFKPA